MRHDPDQSNLSAIIEAAKAEGRDVERARSVRLIEVQRRRWAGSACHNGNKGASVAAAAKQSAADTIIQLIKGE